MYLLNHALLLSLLLLILLLCHTRDHLFHHNVYSPPQSIPQLEYPPAVNQQPQQAEFSQLESGLTVSVFKQGDDPINAINHMMQQATINDGRVTLQPVQERQVSFATGTNRNYTPGASGSNSEKQRTVICYNCKGEGHMSKQCAKPRRKQDDSWFKDKVLLLQAQVNSQILHEEELAFLVDPGIEEANLSHYGLDVLAEVYNPDNIDNNMINQSVHVMQYSRQSSVVSHSETKITNDSNIIPYSQYVHETQQTVVQNSNLSAQQDALILSVIDQLKTQVMNCTKINLDNKNVNDTLTAELERYKEQVKVLKEGQNNSMNSSYLRPSYRPTKVEVPKELPKVSMYSKLNANSELICVKCNGCMLSDNHDLCVLNVINDVNARSKSKSIKKTSYKKVCKLTGKVFTKIRYTSRPTGQTFTIVGNACPLTRITTTAEVPLKKPTALETDTPKPVATLVYSRQPRKSKTSCRDPKINYFIILDLRIKERICDEELLLPSCFAIFELEPFPLSFDFVISSEIFKSLFFNLDPLCHLAILCLDHHAHTLHRLKSLLTISLDILTEDLVYQSLWKSLSLCLSFLDS
nr:hypothetical protein [Tanacetum cinerariifolium]